MNYWHIQLHPDDQGSVDRNRVMEILSKYSVIGMGKGWDNDRGQPDKFKSQMKIGDVVLVRSGGPVALVRVIGQCLENTNKEVWFGLSRKIEVLSTDGDKAKNEFNSKYGKSWQEGMYLPTTLEIANSSLFIKDWYRRITMENLKSNIRLTEERKKEIKTLWVKFKAAYSEKDRKAIQQEIERIETDWNKYRTKIVDNTLTIDDYTNRSGSDTATMPKDYLCNFLERDTKSIYGSSKPGNANNFEVKLNSDGTTYTYRPELQKGDKENKNDRERAILLFNDNIKSLLESIVGATDPLEKIQIIESSNYAAKQVLRKIAAMENKGDFLFMYSDDAVDSLHAEFLDTDTSTNLGKSYEVRQVANEILNVDPKDDVESNLLSTFLWKYATVKGIADDDTPNVILYGPPGTGKTYTVMNSLEFLCQGDRSRYEFVQFHPSFTYEDFIEGIKPKGVSKDGNIKFELVDGVFKRFCKIARAECVAADKENRAPKPYYFVVDEINRANLSSVFGETLLCLEKGYRHDGLSTKNLFKTQYSSLVEEMIKTEGAAESLAYYYQDGSAYFGVPKNLFFIGMMNDVDKSIDAFDLALRRRFKWIRKDCDTDVVREETRFRNGNDFTNIDAYVSAVEKLNTYISETLGLGKSYEFGHSFFMKMTDIASRKEITQKNVVQLFDLHLRPTLKEYLRSLYPEKELDKVLSEALEEFKAPLSK